MTNDVPTVVGSPSIEDPDYWWFTVRSRLLELTMGEFVHHTDRVLDVGSADGPSAAWLKKKAFCISMDLDPRGLDCNGVVGSVMNIPFANESFDIVSAFDVVEHCSDEEAALSEIYRVLKPGGSLLMSVPAYEWAWTFHDTKNAHHRRYNRKRVSRALASANLQEIRLTYAFAGVFPFFAVDRLRTRLRERTLPVQRLSGGEVPPLPAIAAVVEKIFINLSKIDERIIGSHDLPFGSSLFAVARKVA